MIVPAAVAFERAIHGGTADREELGEYGWRHRDVLEESVSPSLGGRKSASGAWGTRYRRGPGGTGGGHPASHRAGDTRGISPPTYPCALERSTMSGKSREPSPSTDISDPAGSRETTERPGSCRPPVDVAKPDRRAAVSSAQRWQIPESGTTACGQRRPGTGPTLVATTAGCIRGIQVRAVDLVALPHRVTSIRIRRRCSRRVEPHGCPVPAMLAPEPCSGARFLGTDPASACQ